MNLDLRPVLAAYPPAITGARWTPVAGGFSGATVWRGVALDGREFALKAHPPAADAGRLQDVTHVWMRSAGLDFVPQVESTRNGKTVAEADGRIWDVCQWMPGQADFHANPSDARLLAAVTAVARLHEAWSNLLTKRLMPCPAIERRWRALMEWDKLVTGGWRPTPMSDDPVRTHALEAWERLPPLLHRVRGSLAPWLHEAIPVQPCLCDVWHDHVLFTGDMVTGLIDYGAAKVDHIAVDLARLLGSLVPGSPDRFYVALHSYQSLRPLPQLELVFVLDWTGVVVGLMNWLRWLYYDGREYADRAAVAQRMAGLIERVRLQENHL